MVTLTGHGQKDAGFVAVQQKPGSPTGREGERIGRSEAEPIGVFAYPSRTRPLTEPPDVDRRTG